MWETNKYRGLITKSEAALLRSKMEEVRYNFRTEIECYHTQLNFFLELVDKKVTECK
ncbi:MAG: hypothetical protein ACK521_07760 [bacterium]